MLGIFSSSIIVESQDWSKWILRLIPRTGRFIVTLMCSRNESLSCGLAAEAVCLSHSFPILPTMPLFQWNAAVMSGRDCRRCSLGPLGPLPSSIVKSKTKTKTLNLSWYSAGLQCNEQSFGVIGFQQPVLWRRLIAPFCVSFANLYHMMGY